MEPSETGKIIENKLQHLGFIYLRSKKFIPGQSSYWECKRLRRSKSCKARAVSIGDGDEVVVTKFGTHEHPPDEEECLADQALQRNFSNAMGRCA